MTTCPLGSPISENVIRRWPSSTIMDCDSRGDRRKAAISSSIESGLCLGSGGAGVVTMIGLVVCLVVSASPCDMEDFVENASATGV